MPTDTITDADVNADAIGLIRQSAAAFVRSGDLRRVRGLRFGTVGFDRSMWRHMCELGWTGLRVPSHRGGQGLGVTALCAIAQEIGAGLFPEPYIAMSAIAPLLPANTLKKVLSGEFVVLPATQETRDALIEGRATSYRSGKLFGSKHFIANATDADAFLVSTDAGLALVGKDAPGLSLSMRRTQDGGWSGTLRLDGAPAEAVDGDFAADREEMTLATSFYLLGAMERAFEMTLDYTQQRRQFDQTIASFQSVRYRLSDLKIQLEITRATLDWAARQLDCGVMGDERSIAVSRAKVRSSNAAMMIANDAVQFHGGMGYTDEGDIGLYARKILVTYNQFGSAASHRQRCFQLGASTPRVQEPVPTSLADAPLPQDLNTLSDDDFRLHVRRWLERNYPEDLPRFPTCMPRRATTRTWYDRLAAKGWLAPGWPREHGGMELSTDKRIVMLEEFDRFGCARFNDQGVLMVGPMLMNYGTEAQRERFLPRIMTGEDIWAQGYSEPGAGSDLAALSTSAVLDGDEWVINGQKTWTTLAHDASWLYVLVRTDKSVRKQEGISILLVPTDAAGVTVRSFKTLGMHDEFADVFFDDVRVPESALVGPLNGGWRIAKNLLGFERIFHGSLAQSSKAYSRLLSLSRKLGVDSDPVFQAELTTLALDMADHGAFYNVCLDAMRRGEDVAPRISMLKVHSSELYKRITRKMIDIAGEYAAIVDECEDTDAISPSALWIQALPATIYGGTVEVQRNIIAQHILRNTR
jgi:alkylation response protein AidB-like acyl-CoA dehydrogenase